VAWLLLILVLLAAAFGVLGAVIKVTAFLVLTILMTVAVLGTVAWYAVKSQVRRWDHDVATGWQGSRVSGREPRDLPSHDDRY
jgi:hypothetical protein